jgi:flagella basal body P-ring formation protein FlgA
VSLPIIALFAIAVLVQADRVAAAGVPPSSDVILKATAVVDGPSIRLGDVFANIDGRQGSVPIAVAPAPGSRVVIDARMLDRIAETYHLPWRSASVRDQVVVQRRASGGGVAPPGLLPATATAAAEDKGLPAVALDRLLRVPVPARRIDRGERIGNADIQWVTLRESEVPAHSFLDDREFAGLSAKRALKPGAPIRKADVGQPVLVSKGQLVTIELNTPYMALTVRGKALENGGEGETIRISNEQSRAVVEAMITGPGRAVITARDAGRRTQER